MTTALVIGDPHFKTSNIIETNAMINSIINQAKIRDIDIIVVLGDILDRHESIHVSPLTRATNFLKSLTEIAPTIVLIGNHDLKNNQQFLSEEHPFVSLKYWSQNITIVDTTKILNIKDHKFVFVPYVPPGRFEEALNKCEGWREATCIFAHQEFSGCQMGAIISTEGDKWPLTFPYVISGHIHDYQEPQNNILYVGTPIQHSFGDKHDKSISYFTFRSSIDRDHKRIDLGLIKKQIVHLTCAEVSGYIPHKNYELKIIISGISGEIKSIMKHPNIDIWKRSGCKIAYKTISSQNIEYQSNQSDPRIQMKFSSLLYEKTTNNERLKPLYTKIFGEQISSKPKMLSLNILQL